jgi:hypothetical protein
MWKVLKIFFLCWFYVGLVSVTFPSTQAMFWILADFYRYNVLHLFISWRVGVKVLGKKGNPLRSYRWSFFWKQIVNPKSTLVELLDIYLCIMCKSIEICWLMLQHGEEATELHISLWWWGHQTAYIISCWRVHQIAYITLW